MTNPTPSPEVLELQWLINTGNAWKMEGHVGREAMRALKSGACVLPTDRHTDFWGNTIPSRTDVAPGTPGSVELCETNFGRSWADELVSL
jgi:hypothetical protein